MNNDTVLMPHERGWAVLRNGMLTKVYPSRHLALQKLQDETARRARHGQKDHSAHVKPGGSRQERPSHRGGQA